MSDYDDNTDLIEFINTLDLTIDFKLYEDLEIAENKKKNYKKKLLHNC